MEKKEKIHFTNESIAARFTSPFELVNYAIRLAENMIKTGRDTRVKSVILNRAMLILEEIHEGKDHFDEVNISAHSSPSSMNETLPKTLVYEERNEKENSVQRNLLREMNKE